MLDLLLMLLVFTPPFQTGVLLAKFDETLCEKTKMDFCLICLAIAYSLSMAMQQNAGAKMVLECSIACMGGMVVGGVIVLWPQSAKATAATID